MPAPSAAADGGTPAPYLPPVLDRDFAEAIASNIAADPGDPGMSWCWLAVMIDTKFSATTALRLFVANLPPSVRDGDLLSLVRLAILALADGNAERYARHLASIRKKLGGRLTGLAAVALAALEEADGIADGSCPPWF